MIVGEIARVERVLVVVPPRIEGGRVLYALPHTLDGNVIGLTSVPSPVCLFESKDRTLADRIAFTLEQWGWHATVRRVSIVTTVEDARPDA